MNKRATSAFSLLLAFGLVTSSCSSSGKSGSKSSSTGGNTISLNGRTANNHGTKDVSGGGSQSVEVDNFYFNPTLFTAKAGDKLTLTLSNESKALHNFSLPEQNIDQDIPIGGKITVTLTFPASGTQVFYCKFHRSSGMAGGLQVEQT